MDSLQNIHNDAVLRFGPYAFHVRQRLVLHGEHQLPLGGRALDILQVLVEQAGEVVSKDTLIAQVWPDSVVEEINLRVHIAALRRALGGGRNGQRYIATVPQRGYCFVARVQQAEATEQCAVSTAPRHNLPVRLTPVIGRDELVGKLARHLSGRRCMTLTGPGGVGKTAVACRVAESLTRHYPDGVGFIDCSGAESPEQLSVRLAQGLGLAEPSSLDGLLDILAQRHALLVFDGCEYLQAPCRRWIECLLNAGSHLSILVTSREPLMIDKESVQPVPGLTVPPVTGLSGIEDAMNFSAVQLFVSRARAYRPEFVLREQEVAIVGDICRRLDGLALAIELVAARIDAFALPGLQARLDNGLSWLSLGRRTAVERHRTLKASLDWSCERLSPVEQIVFQRLSVFRSAFTREAALEVVTCTHLSARCVNKALEVLLNNSLLSMERTDGVLSYGLLHTTRLYALDRLQRSGELRTYEARHVLHLGREPVTAGRRVAVGP
ncbi:ATP-binding protein [Pseudomonas sp. NPDC089734]|uniref:ATP-binding protein n=1 Tax=Pseudomonas sp. NPDC089734 TaxID=3364469 RepID=UPI0037F1594E